MKTMTMVEFTESVNLVLQTLKKNRESIIILTKDSVLSFHTDEVEGMAKFDMLFNALYEGSLTADISAVEKIMKGSTSLSHRIKEDLSSAYVTVVGTNPTVDLWQSNMRGLDYEKYLAYLPKSKTKGAQRRLAGIQAEKNLKKDEDLAARMVAFEDPTVQAKFEAIAKALANKAGTDPDAVAKALDAATMSMAGIEVLPNTGYKWNNPEIGDQLTHLAENLQLLDSVSDQVSTSDNQKTAGAKLESWLFSACKETKAMISTVPSLAADLAKLSANG